MQSFVCTHETWHVGTNMVHRVLDSSTQENGHLTKQKRAGPRGGIELVGLTWVCLQLNCCCDSQSSYSFNRSFPSRPRFPVKHSVLFKYNTYTVRRNYYSCSSTEVGEQPKFLFFSLSKRAIREQHKSSLVPAESTLEVTTLVCV